MSTETLPKTPFDIAAAMPRIEQAVAPFPKAGLFTLHDEGYTTLFEQLVACMLSIRTLDEVMVPVSRQLFAVARTPQQVADLPPERLATLTRSVAFGDTKAVNIRTIAQRSIAEFHGDLPCDMPQLLTLPGVGPKCAGLALAIACHQPHIGVDVHVHRIVNRWGYVAAKTPESLPRSPENQTTAIPLDRYEPPRHAVRQIHLHRHPPLLLQVPPFDHVSANRCHCDTLISALNRVT